MNLPLFPEPPFPTDATPTSDRGRRAAATTPAPEPAVVDPPAIPVATAPTMPLAIRDITALIHERIRGLTALGPRIVHAQWLRPGFNAGPRGFLSVTLADTQDSTMAIDGFIWDRPDVQAILKQGQTFGCDLSDREGRCEVMLEVTIDFWAKKAKPYLRIHRLNQIGMKGLRQQQREATFKRLEHEGLLTRNKALTWPRPALRVLCIAKRESDGCKDAVSILSRSGFSFHTTILNVAVQGISAVPTLLDAFAQLSTRQHEFDVVLLIRGGGSELDLLAYDEFEVAKAVALSPIPVITGLGHTADQSIADAVSYRSLETPTAAARFLVDQIQALHDQLRETRDRLRACAIEQLHIRRRHLLTQRPHFVRHALSRVHDRQRYRVEQWHALYTTVRDFLHQRRQLLHERHQPIAVHARRTLQTHHTFLSQRFGAVLTGAPALIADRRYGLRAWRQTLPLMALTTIVGPARTHLGGMRHHIHYVSSEMVRRALSRLHRVHAHIEAASPDRYFALGLSYVTRSDGSVLRTRTHVSQGEPLEIHLADGTVHATVTTQEHHDH